MANPLFYGFRPFMHRSGVGHANPIPKRVQTAYSPTANSNNVGIGIGDVVKLKSDGTVELAAAGNDVFGVVIGVKQYYSASLGAMTTGTYIPYADGAYGTNYSRESVVLVQPAHGMLFIGQTDEVSSTYDTFAEMRAFEGENVEFIVLGENGRQTPRLDISSHATTNTLSCRIVGVPSTDSQIDFASAYVPLVFEFNLTQNAGTTSTTGV